MPSARPLFPANAPASIRPQTGQGHGSGIRLRAACQQASGIWFRRWSCPCVRSRNPHHHRSTTGTSITGRECMPAEQAHTERWREVERGGERWREVERERVLVCACVCMCVHACACAFVCASVSLCMDSLSPCQNQCTLASSAIDLRCCILFRYSADAQRGADAHALV